MKIRGGEIESGPDALRFAPGAVRRDEAGQVWIDCPACLEPRYAITIEGPGGFAMSVNGLVLQPCGHRVRGSVDV